MTIQREHGASAVEFALVLPLLVVLVFGIVEFGLAMFDKAVITNASREGARAGIVYREDRITDEEIRAVVNRYCQNKLVTFGASKNVTTSITREGASARGDDLTVTVVYKYDYLVLPGFINALAGGINMDATTVMRLE